MAGRIRFGDAADGSYEQGITCVPPDGDGVPPHRLVAIGAGPLALAALRKSGDLTVRVVFERSFYVSDSGSDWLCVLRAGMEQGPLHVLCGNWSARLENLVRPGEIYVFRNGDFFAPDLMLAVPDLILWIPRSLVPPFPAPLQSAFHKLRHSAATHAPADTLLAYSFGKHISAFGVPYEFLRNAAEGLRDLPEWLACPGSALPPGVKTISLLGFGPGLTPSGDDVLAGVLLTLNTLGRKDKEQALWAAISRSLSEATNRISAAHLEAASKGLGAAVFHDCLYALLQGGNDLESVMERIGGIGHNSGWAVLCGMAVTLKSLR